MKNLKQEYNSFVKDLKKNVKDPKDLQYTLTRFSDFFDVMLDQIELITVHNEKKFQEVEEKQKQLEEKTSRIQSVIDNIERDIYEEDGFDFEIICPYCNSEFVIDVDEERTEVKCPECQNIIELDWTGNLEEDNKFGCLGTDCSHCAGKCDEEENNDDDM